MSFIQRTANKDMSSICRHYVKIEELQNVSDGEGGFTEVWATVAGYANVPAGVWPIYALQKIQFRSVNSEATHYFIFRGDINITEAGNRIVFDARTFEILSIENIQERGIRKQVTCKERME